MTRSRPSRLVLSLSLAALLLAACAPASPSLRAWEDEEAILCEDTGADECVVLACDEGECGLFDCEDVDPEALTRAPLAHRA